ncbi:MAG: trypsin-like peptidase domain-containing protein [Myxococcota bacterium]
MRTWRLAILLTFAFVACAGRPPAPKARPLAGLDRSIRALSARVNPSVVRINAISYQPVPRGTSTNLLARGRSVGSGVVIGDGGLVVTNHHVVANATRLWVEVPVAARGESVLAPPYEPGEAQLLGVDVETDIALLRVKKPGLPVLGFGDSEALETGQLVLAFGSPLGLEGSVTMGVVSATARQLEPEAPVVYVQTDTAINPGSSGGPLVDLNGRVVGINTLILSRSGGSEGIGLAVPAHIVKTVVGQIERHGRVRRGVIGASTQTITPALAAALELPRSWGVVVADVHPLGPAAAAGLQPGDVIARLDNREMENARQFQVNVYQREVGSRLQLVILRGKERLGKVVQVLERPDPPSRIEELRDPTKQTVEALGILAVTLTETFAQRMPFLREKSGVLVVTAAADGGFAAGDVIHALGRTPIIDFEDLLEAIEGWPSGRAMVVQLERQGRFRYVELSPAPPSDPE